MLDIRLIGAGSAGSAGSAPGVAGWTGMGRRLAAVAFGVTAGSVPEAVELVPSADRAEAAAFLDDVEHTGAPGIVHVLPRPGRTPPRLLFVGVGGGPADGTEPGSVAVAAGWRAAGAALARAARSQLSLTVVLPCDASPATIGGLAEGLWLASYRFRLGADDPDKAPKLRRVTMVLAGGGAALDRSALDRSAALDRARVVARCTMLARDLTNMPSDTKTPAWFAKRVEKAAAGVDRLSVSVRDPKALALESFGGILAVGGGSVAGPRLVEMTWRPAGARLHVVLIGKGITFDTGGLCIKTRDSMKIMRKDMGGAAAVVAATVGAAVLGLPVRITALAPLAENALGSGAYRPGDVVRHYGGITSEITNTDAEGRIVLGDAIAYAVRRLRPDLMVDLATLTGSQGVALGKRTAALFSQSDALANSLAAAAAAAGELIWRMPLADGYVGDYAGEMRGGVADLYNSNGGEAGAVRGALYLREFIGDLRERWAHIDMSSSAWCESVDNELVKGATGWGVRTLLCWLSALAADPGASLPQSAPEPVAVSAA